ncbi:uncharacterized protein LOC116409784 isoform X2 [Xenopus tropicalis]|nr:uncharacterized protein LOC116409784 isoform X2 [Xenopus tropicalis]XP_031755142.1 uncharacterized protein LOC116409784 isoform X2 [Xenopus tropicalis]
MACNWVNRKSLTGNRFSPWSQDSSDTVFPEKLGPPEYISYPIPPYGTLYQYGRKMMFPIMNRHKIFDMTKKFDINDISYIYLDSFKPNQQESLTPTSYRRESSRTYCIQGSDNKWFVFENGALKGKYLQGANVRNKATVTICKYSPWVEGKIPVTLKIEGPNIFLNCLSGTLQYEATNEQNLSEIDQSEEKFLFFQNATGSSTCSFEPTANTQLTLCTDSASSNVSVQPKSSNTPNVHFSLFPPPSKLFENVGGGRIALRPNETETLDFDSRRLLSNQCNGKSFF